MTTMDPPTQDRGTDEECACVGYTIRTDYGTGIEHDVDRSSCSVHGVGIGEGGQ